MDKLKGKERVWERIYDHKQNEKFLVTSNDSRTTYYLYTKENNHWKKIGRSKTPLAFFDTIKSVFNK